MHKGRHLVKPVLMTAPDGYILDIHGPYFSDAKNNDAAILQNQFETDAGALGTFLGEDAILIVDRGYRDVLPLLDQLGIEHRMPSLLQRGQKQLETEDANDSRLITKTRWIIEARNGHMRSIFKFFKGTISIVHANHLREFYLIAGAIINRYREVVTIEENTAEAAQDLLNRAKTPNRLQERVIAEGLARKNGEWKKINENQLIDFPVLDLNYLKELTIGIYQISLAPAYCQDKITKEDIEVFELDEHEHESGLIRVRVYSRFRNATKHQVWIQYNTDSDEPITGYYCTCQSGARTLGSCAHVASILWYFGYARHQPKIKYPDISLLDSVQDAGSR